MLRTSEKDRPAIASTRNARFRPRALVAWLTACVAAAALAAKAAVVTEPRFAPLVLFPLLVGIGLGAILVAAARLLQTAHRPTVLAGTLLAGLLAVGGQHYFSYRADLQRRQAKFDKHPGAALAFADQLPESFGQFLQRRAASGRALFGRGTTVWLSWGLDAVLLLAAAVVTVALALRLPYCDQCRSWYRVTRTGALENDRAEKLAALADCAPPQDGRTASFRLQNCTGGCGPTGIEIVWRRSTSGTIAQRGWIDAQRRADLNRILDETTGADASASP